MYPEAFRIYQSTYNPPMMDVFWFGMRAIENEFMTLDEFTSTTALEIVPYLEESNWWLVLAAFADYESARDLIPIEWPDEYSGEGLQLKISAANRY